MFKTTIITLLMALILNSCGREEIDQRQSVPSVVSTLNTLRTHYENNIQAHSDGDGFVDVDKCDSLLWTSLIAASTTTLDINIEAASPAPGEWLRRPTSYEECWQAGKSRSTISRDMLLGVMWWSWSKKRLDILEDLWYYGIDKSWFMGDGRLGGADTIFPPSYISLLAELIYALGGEDHNIARRLPESTGECEEFSCHVQTLRILLRSKVVGSTTSAQRDAVKYTHTKYPENPLFHYTYLYIHNLPIQPAVDQLLSYYSLNNPGFCEWWPMQQNAKENTWKRCIEGEDIGGGFLFVSALMLGLL